MSLTRAVPAAVPSLFHSSKPWSPSSARKKSVPFALTRLIGLEGSAPGWMSATSAADGPAAGRQRSSSASTVGRRRGRPRRACGGRGDCPGNHMVSTPVARRSAIQCERQRSGRADRAPGLAAAGEGVAWRLPPTGRSTLAERECVRFASRALPDFYAERLRRFVADAKRINHPQLVLLHPGDGLVVPPPGFGLLAPLRGCQGQVEAGDAATIVG